MGAVQVVSKRIRIMGPNSTEAPEKDRSEIERQIEEIVQNLDWSMIETLISDSMPEGYYCKIED